MLNDVWHSAVIDLALELSGLNSGFQGLKCVWWWGVAPMKEMVMKEIRSGNIWIGLWIM